MNNYRIINISTGWFAFLVAAITFLLTMEPTASFWDCGEFIATAYKLQVGHPPGAPLFMIVARVFSLFAFGDVTKVAMMINALSALASAFTILFLFWTITHLAKKMLANGKQANKAQTIAIMGSGLIGSLAYAFSDTFWFSAVEAEVYASSSLFTAVVFWAILKWENVANEKYANRWLILIAYLIGLSIGVHLLNLLAIPAIVLVYYLKKYEPNRKGIIYASIAALVLLGGIMYVIIPGVVKTASWFELLFVNTFGLPFNSGAIFYVFLLIGLIIYGLYYTYINKKVLANTIILGVTVIIIGYSSFTMIVIRSYANPPIDENNPENAYSMLSYLNREQYGDRPLFYGQYYNAPVVDQKNKFTYIQKNGKYEKVTMVNPNYKYDERFMTLLPRMYSHQSSHVRGYKSWASIEGKPITVDTRGEPETLYKPTFFDNIEFLFRYQIGHMYLRYFMWNFVGRQNDTQGHDFSEGNWISGINFIDNFRIGTQSNLPEKMANEPSRNAYYFLPLILGLIGLIYSLQKDIKTFWIVMLLFFFTGIAIVLYLNQTPYQPRERDYAYAGSFYAFAIWIGFGVLGIYQFLKEYVPEKASAGVSLAVCLLIPGLLAAENWDDHDRSGRYTARDLAANYLNSCAPNAILFTYGDNDTFPLWYAQEVEGVRTDVRVVNLSLLGTHWYINQMKRQAYESAPVPFSMPEEKYVQGERDLVPVIGRIERRVKISEVLKFLASDDQNTKVGYSPDEMMNYIPTTKISIPVDSAKVVTNGTVPPEMLDSIVNEIHWDIPKSYFTKSEVMILDLLATFNWDRPVYFASSIGKDNFLGLQAYFQQEGFAYRLVPFKTPPNGDKLGYMNAEITYDNLMNKFKWGRMNADDVYIDEQNRRTFRIMGIRDLFVRLTNQLITEQKTDSAKAVINRCFEVVPDKAYPFDYFTVSAIECLYKLEEYKQGDKITNQLFNNSIDELGYYASLSEKFDQAFEYERNMALYTIQELADLTKRYNRFETNEYINKRLDEITGNQSFE